MFFQNRVLIQVHGIDQHDAWAHPTARKWVITPVINGISRLNPLITGVTTHLLSGMSHQEWYDNLSGKCNKCKKVYQYRAMLHGKCSKSRRTPCITSTTEWIANPSATHGHIFWVDKQNGRTTQMGLSGNSVPKKNNVNGSKPHVASNSATSRSHICFPHVCSHFG